MNNFKKIFFFGYGYRPAHFDVIDSFFECVKDICECHFFLNHLYYENHPIFFNNKHCINIDEYPQFNYKKGDIAFIISPNRRNIKLIKHLKRKGLVICYIYHEPYRYFHQYYAKSGYNFKKIIKSIGLAFYNGMRLVKSIDKIILPSDYAKCVFMKNYPSFKGDVFVIPLMFKSNNKTHNNKREFFSFIGTIDSSRNFDKFISYILKSKRETKYLIASSKKMDEELIKKLVLKFKDRIEFKIGNRLTDEEISDCYSKSYAVWLMYKNSTQSGVLPSCYKNKTPVIASNHPGISQNVKNDTGVIIDDVNDIEAIDNALNHISKNIQFYTAGANKYFENYFNIETNKEVVIKLFKENILEGR